MSQSTTPKFKLIPTLNRFSIKYDYILFPIESNELLDSLIRSNRGYLLLPAPRMPKAPIGARIDVAGTLARKGNAVIDFDGNIQVLGIDGAIPNENIEILTEIEEILKSNLGFTHENHYKFYECISTYSVYTEKNPLTVFDKIKLEGNILESIQSIISNPVTTFGIHLCLPSTTIEQNDWFDIKIQPDVNKSSSAYDVMMIYRSKDRSKVANFLSNAEKNIVEIIKKLEEKQSN